MINKKMDINQTKKMLLEHQINIEKWDHHQGTKTVEDLHREILAGETTLEIIDDKLVRVLKLTSIQVQVKLGEKLFTLVEDKQIFFTGAVRERGLRNLAEKMRHNETPEETAYRALKEEIGLTTDKKLIFQGETQEIKTSPSYPQLDSIYKVYNFSLMLDSEDLGKIKFSEYQKNKGKITLFSLAE